MQVLRAKAIFYVLFNDVVTGAQKSAQSKVSVYISIHHKK
jgi:hypothetical protein